MNDIDLFELNEAFAVQALAVSRARKLRYGIASLCIGGEMGIAMAVEAL